MARASFAAARGAKTIGGRQKCSDYAPLPDGRRLNFLHAVEAAPPDQVEIDWLTNLYLAPLR